MSMKVPLEPCSTRYNANFSGYAGSRLAEQEEIRATTSRRAPTPVVARTASCRCDLEMVIDALFL